MGDEPIQDETIEVLENEARNVSALLGFLIMQESPFEKSVGIDLQGVRALNLTRLALTDKWVEEMKKELSKKYGKELFSQYEKLKSMLVAN